MGMFVVAPASSFNHHHHHHHHHPHLHESLNISSDPMNTQNAATALGVGVGVIPLLTATPCLPSHQNLEDQDLLNNMNGRNKINQFQFWQNQNSHPYLKKASTSSATLLDQHNNSSSLNLIQTGNLTVAAAAGDSGNNRNSSHTAAGSGSSSGTTCQDCGNQAKKDCSHRRCRTCCKSRGFDCSTHVKSTWVPASRRRERQLMTGGAVAGAGSSVSTTSGIKKPRLVSSQTTTTSHTSTSNTTPPRSFDTSSSHQDASFKESLPGQVRAPAVFKCVRVTAVEDGEDEYAYQAVVKIGGHVFKGFLYDQGVDDQSREGFPNLSELHLGGASSSAVGGSGGGGAGGRNGACSSSPNMLDPSDYATAAGCFLGGSSYGNPIN